jgi:hypothetical protein
MLAQQASCYDVGERNYHVQEKPMHENFNFICVGTDQSAKPTNQVCSANSLSAVAKSARPTTLVGEADSSMSAKPTTPVDSPVTSPVNLLEKLLNRSDVTSSDVGADLED